MRRSFLLPLSVLLVVGVAAGGHAENLTQFDQLPVSPPADKGTQAPTPPTESNPEVTVTGKAPHEPPLPVLPPDESLTAWTKTDWMLPSEMEQS